MDRILERLRRHWEEAAVSSGNGDGEDAAEELLEHLVWKLQEVSSRAGLRSGDAKEARREVFQECPEPLREELARRASLVESFLNVQGLAMTRRLKPEGPAVVETEYTTLEVLNSGAQGVVCSGEDRHGRKAALKFPLEGAAARLENEARVLSRLEHPGIVPFLGWGRDCNGRPCYAMTLFDSGTLADRVVAWYRPADRTDHERPPTRVEQEALRIFRQLCGAIQYAHEQGIIHRDIHPLNVIMRSDDPIIIDWGLAKVLAEPDWSMPAFGTASGVVVGMHGFRAPELESGNSHQADQRSDIYSLGAILFYMLTGRQPEVAASLKVSRMPRALAAIIAKALASEPMQRYRSIAELIEDLDSWQADEPITAWREPLVTKARRLVYRHRTLVTSASVALISGLIAFGAFLYDLQIQATRQSARRLAQARGLVAALEVADIRATPAIVHLLDPDSALVTDRLYAMAHPAPNNPDSDRLRTAAAFALLHTDPSQADYLVNRLAQEETPSAELLVIRQALIDRGRAIDVKPRFWKLLQGGPRARTEFIHLISLVDSDPNDLVHRLLSSRDDARSRSILIRALGGYSIDRIPSFEREDLIKFLLDQFRSSPDPGLHSAISWVLAHEWGLAQKLSEIEAQLAPLDREATRSGRPPTRDWYVNGQMQTFTLIRGPVEFQMGSPVFEAGRRPWAEDRHWERIDRTFAIATREVTREQYKQFLDKESALFRPDHPSLHENFGKYMPKPDCPVIGVNWYEAARYCNWLSLQEGIDPSQWCYPHDVDPERPLTLSPDYLRRTGYRLPTEAEWEFACRAGTETARPFGESEAWMPSYAWYLANSGQRTQPVGSKMPNDLGLFDMLGNAIEWTFQVLDPLENYPDQHRRSVVVDNEILTPINGRIDCMLRGGSFYYDAPSLRSANRNWNRPDLRENTFGFRTARTFYIKRDN
jgi:formylglycine-generating enzyme required for sulfatase activity